MDNNLLKNQCPFCKEPLAFYEVKRSDRYIWRNCVKCGCKRRSKIEEITFLTPFEQIKKETDEAIKKGWDHTRTECKRSECREKARKKLKYRK